MKLFTFYEQELESAVGVFCPIKISGDIIEGFAFTWSMEWSWRDLSYVRNIKDDWKDENIISSDKVYERHELIELIWTKGKE